MSSTKTVSVIIPFFNEGSNVVRIYEELAEAWKSIANRYTLEVLFMDNSSEDESPRLVDEIVARDPRVRRIRLSRNFGHQANILSGLVSSTGDATVQIDADGEDDPRLILRFIELWEQGHQVVYGVRKKREEGPIVKFQRIIFYRLLRWLSSTPVPVDAGDFRLLDRKVVHCLSFFKEANPYLRGLIAYSGFRQIGVPYDRRKRYLGESKFTYFQYVQLALDGITSFSRKPLALATWVGILLSMTSFLAAGFYFIKYLVVGAALPGFTTLVLVQLFLAGVQLFCIGIMGAYIGRIFDDVKQRPRAIVDTEKPERI